MTERPNILLITTDQQRADHLGCYGNKVIKTPAIDSLAERGVRFEQFYVACPICMPNRVAILTGRMPSINGTRHNGIPLSRDAVTFVDLLRAGGYHTGLAGKCHAQNITGQALSEPRLFPETVKGESPPARLSDAHRERRTGADYDVEMMPLWHGNPDRDDPELPYYGFNHVRFANGHADHVQGHYTHWLNQQVNNGDALRGKANALASPHINAPQAWRTAVPEHLYPTAYIAEESRNFIDAHLINHPDRPFFLHCSFTDPHHPFTPPGKYFDMYSPDDMALPVSFDHVDPDEPPLLTILRASRKAGTAKTDGPMPFCASESEIRQILALTYGMISCIDDAIASLLAFLEEKDLTDNTIIVFTSDHGDFMGDHGLMLKHGLHYEGVIRVPFIFVDPARSTPAVSAIPGSSIDIGATLLSRAGLAPYNGFQGLDLLAIHENTRHNPRQGILIEEDELGAHMGMEQGTRVRSYIENNWRLTLWHGTEGGELFDRNTDPHELHNLWREPNHHEKKAQLTEAALREMIRLNDTAPLATHVA